MCRIEINKVVLMHCNVINSSYQKIQESCIHLLLINCLANYQIFLKENVKDVLKTSSKKGIQQTAKAAGILIGNKIFDKTTRVSKTSPQNNSEKMKKKYLEKDLYPQN